MAVVVTGAAGFIGSRLARRLVRSGFEVIGMDRLNQMPSEVTAVVCDLAAPSAQAREALATADAVWHLAARPGVRDAAADIERRRFLDNVCATHIVCDLVPDDVPLTFTSSSSVYGGAVHGGKLEASSENDELRPAGGYARSKLRAERACSRRMKRGGLVCVARPFTVVGSPQRPDMALARWTRAALQNQPLKVFGSLQRSRDLTDVDAVVEALVSLARVGMGEVVNIGTGASYTLEQMIQTVLDVTASRSGVVLQAADRVEVPVTLADTSKLVGLTGITPSTDLHAIVEAQVRYLLNDKDLDENVEAHA